MIEHHIQKYIIDQLMKHDSMRFSELKPDGMESNIFMYHVKSLIRDGYVAKDNKGYCLAAGGLQYVDGLSSSSLKLRKQPKLIAILALQAPDGRWLLAERLTQPYIGQLMFPSGKQHFGETMMQHAERELQEKIGRELELSYRGLAEILIGQDGTLLTQVIGHVHSGMYGDRVLPPDTPKLRFVWHDFTDDGIAKLMPGTQEIYAALQRSAAPFQLVYDNHS